MATVRPLLYGRPFQTTYGIVGYSSVVLVEDEDKKILFDCGNRSCSIQLKEALQQAGVCPEDITDVVVSHLHFDHVGNLPLFKRARILMSETEWEVSGEGPDEYHCIATREYIRSAGHFSFLGEGDRVTSGISVLSLPGHTLGLIGLKCDTEDGTVVLCSDAVKNRFELWDGVKPMSVDYEKSSESFSRILSLADIIIPGHDCPLDLRSKDPGPLQIRIRWADGSMQDVSRDPVSR